jgi:uncharacterized membrane protein
VTIRALIAGISPAAFAAIALGTVSSHSVYLLAMILRVFSA